MDSALVALRSRLNGVFPTTSEDLHLLGLSSVFKVRFFELTICKSVSNKIYILSFCSKAIYTFCKYYARKIFANCIFFAILILISFWSNKKIMTEMPNNRLRLFLQSIKLPQYKLAQLLGTNPTQVNRFLKDGYEIKDANVLETLERLGMNKIWYRTGEGDMFNNKGANDNLFDNLKSNVQPSDAEEFARRQNTQNGSYLVKIQHALVAVNSGIPVDSKQEYITMENDMSVSENARGFNVVSDEMTPTLSPRHYVILEPIELRVDNIVVFKIGKNFICRRIKLIEDETITLTADNKAYEDIRFERQAAEYIGTVVNIQLTDI